MTIIRSAARPTRHSPPEHFTGRVFSDPIFVGVPPSRMRASIVSFTPGARTAWHSHSLGQTLYVVSGVGRIQIEDGPVEEIGPGDTVVIPPNARHWHGAAPDRMFAHLAMSERAEGGESDWYEQVSDADYTRAPAART